MDGSAMRHAARGFTLIEVMIAITIMGEDAPRQSLGAGAATVDGSAMRHAARGFTLIEVMIAITIMG
ncbi:hypothetical protein C7E18_24045, partial [Stenotrophomonas maltophilia]